MYSSSSNEDRITKNSSEQIYYNPSDFFQLADNYYNNNNEMLNYQSSPAIRSTYDPYYNYNYPSYNYNNYISYNTMQGFTDYTQSENNFHQSPSDAIPIEYLSVKNHARSISPPLCENVHSSYLQIDTSTNSVNAATTDMSQNTFIANATSSFSAKSSSFDTSMINSIKSDINDDILSTTEETSDSSETLEPQEIDEKSLFKPKKTQSKSRKKPIHHHALPEKALQILNYWFEAHIDHPYPTIDQKEILARESGITVKQVNSWFCNKRNRSQNTKPKRFKRHLEQEISKCFYEFKSSPNKVVLIEKLRNTLLNNDLNIRKYN